MMSEKGVRINTQNESHEVPSQLGGWGTTPKTNVHMHPA